MLPETIEYGWLNGDMVYGDENRNIASETFPDIYFPSTLIKAKTHTSFHHILNIFLFNKYHYYRERTVIKPQRLSSVVMHEDLLRMPRNCGVLTILKNGKITREFTQQGKLQGVSTKFDSLFSLPFFLYFKQFTF